MFGSFEPFLEIFSSKKFSRVVVYCSVIKVPVVLFKRQPVYSTKAHFVCQELFSFSVSLFRFLCSQLSATACLGYHISTALSTSFFNCFPTPPVPLLPLSGLRLSRLRVSGRPDFLRLFRPRHQRQVLSYHPEKELSTFFLFFIYFRQFAQF